MVSAKLRNHSAAESRFEAKNLEKYCVFEGTNHDASIFTCKCGQHWPMWANKPNVSRCGATWGKYEKNMKKIRKKYEKIWRKYGKNMKKI